MDKSLIELILSHQLFEDIELIDPMQPLPIEGEPEIDYEDIINQMYKKIGLTINHDNYPLYKELLDHLKTLFLLGDSTTDEIERYKQIRIENPSDYLFMYSLTKRIEMEQLFYIADEEIMSDAMSVFINKKVETELEEKFVNFVHEIYGTDGLLYLMSLEDKAPLTSTKLYEKDKKMINALFNLDITKLDEDEVKKFNSYIAVISAR